MIGPKQGQYCDRCGSYIEGKPKEIILPYRKFGVMDLCDPCSKKADSFVDYCGVKTQKDIESLRRYLQSGSVSGELLGSKFSKLMNAGY